MVEGTVRDQTGAGIGGAQVTLHRLTDDTRATAMTGPAGTFAFPFVRPGRYELQVEAGGFRPAMHAPFDVTVASVLPIDVVLAVEATDAVVVRGDAPLLATAPAVGATVGADELARLPVADRNYLSLAALAPGVLPAPAGANPFSISGARADHVNFAIDGFSNVNRRGNEPAMTPPLDAIQEFRVSTTPRADEPARLESGTVSVALKSGTDRLTGSAYEFYRSGALEGRNEFTPDDPSLRRHEAGGTIGGPLVPHRTFVFASAQVLTIHDVAQQLTRVPTASERAGIFSTAIRDPLTRRPFPGNTIPAGRIDPVASAYLALVPLPTRDGALNYAATAPTSTTRYQPLVKVDHEISTRARLSALYMGEVTDASDPFRSSALPAFGSSRRTRNHVAGLTHTWIAGANMVVESRASFTHQSFDEDAAAAVSGPALPGVDPAFGPANIVIAGLPAIGHATFLPDRWVDRELTISTTASWVHGGHSVRAGGQFQRSALDNLFASYAGGQIAFQGSFTGNPFADFLLGLPVQTTRQVGTNLSRMSADFVGLFAQDEWHIGDRTTLFAGVRYGVQTPPVERDDHWANFIPSEGQIVDAGGPLGRSVLHTDFNNVAPSVTIARRIGADDRAVLRAGYGLTYSGDLLFTQYQMLGATAFPFTQLQTFRAVAVGTPSLANPFPSAGASAPGATSPNGWDVDNPTPYEHVWHAGVTLALGARQTLETLYIGSRGRDQTVTVNLNQPQRTAAGSIVPYPAYGRILFQTFDGRSQYDALAVSFDRRPSAGLSFRTSVTWSRSYDDASFGSPARLPQDPTNIAAEWGPSEFDRPWTWTGDLTWDVPARLHGAAQRVLGGWQVGTVLVAASGRPFTPIVSTANQQAGVPIRPDLTGDPSVPNPDAARWFNPGAFTPVPGAAFRMGTAGRDSLRGPGELQIDLSLAKTIRAGSRELQLRVDAFNLPNRVNLGQPDPRIDQPTAGVIGSAGAPRQIQLGVRLLF